MATIRFEVVEIEHVRTKAHGNVPDHESTKITLWWVASDDPDKLLQYTRLTYEGPPKHEIGQIVVLRPEDTEG